MSRPDLNFSNAFALLCQLTLKTRQIHPLTTLAFGRGFGIGGKPASRKEYIAGLPRLSPINIDFGRFVLDQRTNNPCVDGLLGEFAFTQ